MHFHRHSVIKLYLQAIENAFGDVDYGEPLSLATPLTVLTEPAPGALAGWPATSMLFDRGPVIGVA
jgi:hypothetical protein